MREREGKRVAKRLSCLGRRGEVLAGIWAGQCTKEIAAELGISAKTVEFHRAKLYQQFRVNNSVSLCRRGLELRLIRLQEKS